MTNVYVITFLDQLVPIHPQKCRTIIQMYSFKRFTRANTKHLAISCPKAAGSMSTANFLINIFVCEYKFDLLICLTLRLSFSNLFSYLYLGNSNDND